MLHCTTEYPAPIKDLNLKAIQSMKKYFDLNIGFSDHSRGNNPSKVATLIGAKVIEKHFTINRNWVGPDHKASSNPIELKKLVSDIRLIDEMQIIKKREYLKNIKNLDIMLGDGKKKARPSEIKNIDIARRYLVANQTIDEGEIFSIKNLVIDLYM